MFEHAHTRHDTSAGLVTSRWEPFHPILTQWQGSLPEACLSTVRRVDVTSSNRNRQLVAIYKAEAYNKHVSQLGCYSIRK